MSRWFRIATVTPVLFVSAQSLGQGVPVNQAQETSVDYSRSVAERPLDIYGNQPMRLGSWNLFPGVELEESYDTNIFATDRAQVEDYITVIRPRARLQSDWNVHEVSLDAGADLGFYSDYNDENFEDYFVSNSNRFEVIRGTDLTTGLLYRHAHEPRTSPNSSTASEEPLTYDLWNATVAFERDVSVLRLRADVGIEGVSYDDGTQIITGRTIDNADRDRTTFSGGVRLTYSAVPDSGVYGFMRLREVSYDDSTVNGGPDRDNSGYDLGVGLTKTVSEIWTFDGNIGYSPRRQVDPTLDDVTGESALALAANLLWNPTALTSVLFNLSRQGFETTEPGASALISNSGSVRVEHQLTDFTRLDAGVSLTLSDYDGAEREDTDLVLSLGAAHYFTRLFSVRAGYSYRERDSNQEFSDYDKHVFMLQARVNY